MPIIFEKPVILYLFILCCLAPNLCPLVCEGGCHVLAPLMVLKWISIGQLRTALLTGMHSLIAPPPPPLPGELLHDPAPPPPSLDGAAS